MQAFTAAAIALVLPQLPLTFANSCLATADAARTYFGAAAERVWPGRLALTLGLANLVAGGIGGMPVCHGAGGLTAHYSFGARTGGAPIMLGGVLLVLAIGVGASLTALLSGFPLPILAGLLAVAGLLHITLLKDVSGPFHWALAIGVGVIGFLSNLAIALIAALAVWWGARALGLLRAHR
jgi:sulfate permease, SulP family